MDKEQGKKRSSFSAAMEFLTTSSRKPSLENSPTVSGANNYKPNNFNKLPPDQILSMLHQGITSDNRGELWFNLSGANSLRANSDGDMYDKLIRNLEDTDDEYINNIKQTIENDLKRYKPDRISNNPLYHQSNKKSKGVISIMSTSVGKLRRICLALALYIPEIGYNQAYLPIVRFVQNTITYFEEDETFWFLASFFSFILPPYFVSDMGGVRTDQYILEQLVKRYFKSLKQHLESIEVDLGLLTYHWFLSILVDQVPQEVLLKTWDMVLLVGSHTIFDPILFTLSKMQDTIIAQTTTREIKKHFDETLKSLTVDEFERASVSFYNAHAYILETRRISVAASSSIMSSPKSFLSRMSRKSVKINDGQNKTTSSDINDDKIVVHKDAIQKSKVNRDKSIMKLNAKLDKINKSIEVVENKLCVLKQHKMKIESKLHDELITNQNISVLEEGD